MIDLHSQSGPTEVYNKSSQIQVKNTKELILPPWDCIVFSNVYDNSSKIWINNEQLCHWCSMLDVYMDHCV